MPPRKAPEATAQKAHAAPQTPPRKKPRSSEVDGVSSDAKASANSAGSGGPQVVFSPGKRVQADGYKHDAGAEVRAFLRHQGYSDQEIRTIMTSEAGSGRRQAQAKAAPKAPPAAGPGAEPKRFADLAHSVSAGSGGARGEEDDFAADLMDVLGMDDDPGPPAASSTQAPATAPGAASSTQAPGAAASGAAAADGTRPSPLSQLPAGLTEDLCAMADRIDVEVASQRSQQASQPSPILSQIPPALHADLCASADEIDRLVEDEAFHASQAPEPLPPHAAPRPGMQPTVPTPQQQPMATQPQSWQAMAPPQAPGCGAWRPGMPAPPGMPAWQQGCAPRPGPPAWGQQPPQRTMPGGPYATQLMQPGGCAMPGQQPWGMQQGQPLAFSQPMHMQPGRPPMGQQMLPMQHAGRPPMPGQPCPVGPGMGAPAYGANQGSLLNSFEDDDDEDILAALQQVEDKVKQEQDYEKILKEKEEELNLELMLVDVDPNEC